jgi:hypothetical protein
MFLVTESDAAAIRAAYEQSGELAAAVELRRRFKGITDNEKARACVRSIIGWKPLPAETQETPAQHPKQAHPSNRNAPVRKRPAGETAAGGGILSSES